MSSVRPKWQERGLKGYGGSIYSLQPKNSRWAKGYPETPGICPKTPGNPDFFSPETAPGHSGQWDPEYPALYPEYPGKAGNNLRLMTPLSCFVAHKCLYRFS